MKHMRLTFLTCFALFFLFIPACKKDDNPEIDPSVVEGEIELSDLLGIYEVVNNSDKSTNESDKGGRIDAIWNITDQNISIACGEVEPYTFKDDVLTVNKVEYAIKEMEKGKIYDLTYKNETVEITISLKKTTRVCENEEPSTGPIVGDVELDKLYGYGVGTTGGEGATAANIHHFNDGNKFREWLKLREKAKSKVPAEVWLSGTFTKENGRDASSPWFDIKDTENISIYGTDDFKMQNVGLFIVRSENIIIRNLYIVMPKADNGADGISMQKSNKIWVDHCTFESVNSSKDYEDGSCDITHGTTNVTVSWNHFIKAQKTALVGHSDSETADAAITATFHHNFFDLSNSRHPRVRYGTVHVYNNFFNKVSTYGVGSAMEAKVLVESNFFDGVHLPTDICTYPAKQSGSSWVSNLTGKKAGFLFAAENVYVNKPSNASSPHPFTNVEYLVYNGEKLTTPLTRAEFTPAYEYIVDKAEDLNTIVPAGAGVGKLPNFDTAPVAIDNGNIPDAEQPEEPGEEPGDGDGGVELGGGWISKNIGNADGLHTIGSDGKSISMEGKGKFESGVQAFNYIYREQMGDFEMIVRLDSYDIVSASNQGLAGILFTPDVNAVGNDFLHALTAKGSKSETEFNYSARLSNANASRGVLGAPANVKGSTYLKLKREGDSYSASYSLDGGLTYGNERKGSFADPLPDKVYLGLAINSGNNTITKAVFSDIKINGNAVTFIK